MFTRRRKKITETPEERSIRLAKCREYARIRNLNETPLQRERRLSYSRKYSRMLTRRNNRRRKMQIKNDELFQIKIEDKPLRKYVARKPRPKTLPYEHDFKTVPPEDDVEFDWQDVFTTRLGLQENSIQEPQIKLEKGIEGCSSKNCLKRLNKGVNIKREIDDDESDFTSIPLPPLSVLFTTETDEDSIEVEPEVKQEIDN